MSATIEARRLSGSDLGKTVQTPGGNTGTLWAVTHISSSASNMSVTVVFDAPKHMGGRITAHLRGSDQITITGRPS